MESGTIEAKRMVERKLGIGIVPRTCVHEEVEGGKLRLKRIAELQEERTLWAARRRHDPQCPASQVFMEVIVSATKKRDPLKRIMKTVTNRGAKEL